MGGKKALRPLSDPLGEQGEGGGFPGRPPGFGFRDSALICSFFKLLHCSIYRNIRSETLLCQDRKDEAGSREYKKYPNRRLYDTSAGRYVNLDDVAILIRQGVDVQVVDARTGEDLTRVVLTQIIVEDVKGQPTSLPLDLLRQLVIATDRAGGI